MRIGIDFGTSFSAAGAIVGGKLQLVRFGEQCQLRTAAYFPISLPNPNDFALTPSLERQVRDLLASAKAEQSKTIKRIEAQHAEAGKLRAELREKALTLLPDIPKRRTDDQLRSEIVLVVRREWLERETARSKQKVRGLTGASYGDAAVEEYIREGQGHLVQSPKSLLGYRLEAGARKTIVYIVSSILEHIRLTSSQQFGTSVREATIGRPVQFRSSMGALGNDHAETILREAATLAGFDTVAFMEEPAAAAMHYHRSSPKKHKTLVVDVGGGTVDFAYAEVGGKTATPRVLQSWGLAQGGFDVDLWLSLTKFMPLFGKGALSRMPVHVYARAASVHDLPAQRDFFGTKFSDVPPPFCARLKRLQEPGNTVRLNRAVEQTKIWLSDHQSVRVDMGVVEKGLGCSVSQEDLVDAASRFISPMTHVMENIKFELEDRPDSLFLTGGMSRAPYVQDAIQSAFPGIKLVLFDASLGVVSGLGAAAGLADGR